MSIDDTTRSSFHPPFFRVMLWGPFRVERRRENTYEPVKAADWGGSNYPRLLLKALLCCPERRCRREALLEMLWPEIEIEQATANLNTATTKLRRFLRPARGQESLLVTEDDASIYQLPPQNELWVDSEAVHQAFERAERSGRTSAEAMPLLEEAISLSNRGTYLEGEEVRWATEKRATHERERYRGRIWLAESYINQGRLGLAETILTTLLEDDPFDEDILCRLLLLLHGQGMTHQALLLYRRMQEFFTQEHLVLAEATHQLAARLEQERQAPPFQSLQHITSKKTPDLSMDWSEASSCEQFYGRVEELAQLRSWIEEQHCRVVALCGMGGIGKTSLAARVVDIVKGSFHAIFWRSLQQAPPFQRILREALLFISEQQQTAIPEDEDAAFALLIERLRASRCFFIFDNCETIMESGTEVGAYREGYEGYGRFIQCMGEMNHQNCLLLTSRERMQELSRLEGRSALTHTLFLHGIGLQEGRALLQEKGITGSDEAFSELLKRYAGNPLALKLIAEPILTLFNADITAFLQEGQTALRDIRHLIAQQFSRLSELERVVLYWLAIERAPVTQTTIWDASSHSFLSKKQMFDTLMSLQRRSLLQVSAHQTITLQPVVMEYVTDDFVSQIKKEIETGSIHFLSSHALLKTQVSDSLREAQMRLILAPLAEQLLLLFAKDGIEKRCQALLTQIHQNPHFQTGYAAGNLLNLLLFMQSDLRGYDFSHLAIRQAFLQGKQLSQVNFAGAHFSAPVFTETFGCVFTVAFHPDGKRLAAGTACGEIRLWNMQDGLPLSLYQGHTDWVRSIAFHPFEEIMVSGSEDQTLRLWDLIKGRCMRVLQGHINRVRSVAFHPDGRLIASGSEDQTVRIWETHTGKCARILRGHTDQVRAVAFHPDGKSLASGSEDGTIKLWDIQTGMCLKTFLAPAAIYTIAIHPNGQHMVSGGDTPHLTLWNWDTGNPLKSFSGHTKRVRSVAFSPDGRSLLSGSEDQTVKLWNSEDGTCIHTFFGHTNAIFSVAWSLDSSLIASGGEDQTVSLWERETRTRLKIFRGYSDQIRSLTFSPGGCLMASGGEDQTVKLWDARNGQIIHTFVGHQKRVRAVAFSPDGNLVASGSEDQTVRIWSVATGQCVRSLRGHKNRVRSVAFSPDGRLVASGSEDREISLWEVATGQRLKILQGHTNRVRSVAFSPDGAFLASGSEDQTVRIWNVASAECLKTLQGPTSWMWSISFSPDGKIIASGCEDGTILLWKRESGLCEKVLSGHRGRICAVAFSPDGEMLASGSEDQTVRLWNRADGICTHICEGHASRVWAVSFSSDGQTLASGSHDGTIKLWNIQSGQCLASLRSPRPYERMNIANASGLTPRQESMLYELGAICNEQRS